MREKKQPLVRSLALEIRLNLFEEFRAWVEILTANWLYVTIAILGLVLVLIRFNPMPPGEVFLGAGQKGSSYREIGKEYANYFANYGIALQSIESQGLSEDLNRVMAAESPVSAGFYVAGSTDLSGVTSVRSLGSIQFSPIWVFYRGPEISPAEGLSRILKSRVAVGNANSSSRAIFAKIAALHGVNLDTTPGFLQTTHSDAADKLRRGLIDAMVIVDSIDSPLIQSLLKTPSLRVLDFASIDAYQKHLPFLQELVIPAKSLDLEHNDPPKPIHLLSTTVTLLVETDTHPMVQWVFLKAARHISNMRPQFFSEPGYFPVYLDHSIPLSKIAKRYYETGLPPLSNFVPLWVADLIDRAWFYVLAGFTLFLPLLRLLVASRTYYSNQIIENAFIRLLEIQKRIDKVADDGEAATLIVALDQLEAQLGRCWLASSSIREIFGLKSRIDGVRDRIDEKRQELGGRTVAVEETAASNGLRHQID